MSKRTKTAGDMIAMSRIEHGEIVDGKNMVSTFEPGEVVDLAPDVLAGLAAVGAVNAFTVDMMSPEDRMKAAEARALADAEKAKKKPQEEARDKWKASADLKAQFPDVEQYVASLNL